MATIVAWLRINRLYVAWGVSLLSTLGSLFFSEILHFTPCVLCWYQRICMYPLVFLLTVAIVKKDKLIPYYVLPLSLVGMLIGIYHNLLYYNILPESVAPCRNGVSCTTQLVNYFGFITIPLLSLIAFSVISALMWWQWKETKNV
jgi:disulfide bond formation protein DsbB